jgi:hypothetical protein
VNLPEGAKPLGLILIGHWTWLWVF